MMKYARLRRFTTIGKCVKSQLALSQCGELGDPCLAMGSTIMHYIIVAIVVASPIGNAVLAADSDYNDQII